MPVATRDALGLGSCQSSGRVGDLTGCCVCLVVPLQKLYL